MNETYEVCIFPVCIFDILLTVFTMIVVSDLVDDRFTELKYKSKRFPISNAPLLAQICFFVVERYINSIIYFQTRQD